MPPLAKKWNREIDWNPQQTLACPVKIRARTRLGPRVGPRIIGCEEGDGRGLALSSLVAKQDFASADPLFCLAAMAETDSESDDELPPLPEAPPAPVSRHAPPTSLEIRAEESSSLQDFGENGNSFLTSVAEKGSPRPITASKKQVRRGQQGKPFYSSELVCVDPVCFSRRRGRQRSTRRWQHRPYFRPSRTNAAFPRRNWSELCPLSRLFGRSTLRWRL